MTKEELRKKFESEYFENAESQITQYNPDYVTYLENFVINSGIFIIKQEKFCQCKQSAPSTTTGGTVKCAFCGRLCR